MRDGFIFVSEAHTKGARSDNIKVAVGRNRAWVFGLPGFLVLYGEEDVNRTGLHGLMHPAVRLTHIETQTSFVWGAHRTQQANIDQALRVLPLLLRSQPNDLLLRTYQAGDVPFVRDHVLGLEEGDVSAVLKGGLYNLIREHLCRPLRLLSSSRDTNGKQWI